jgi:hypothetical protein
MADMLINHDTSTSGMMVERRIKRTKIVDRIKGSLLLLRISSPLILNEWRLFWSVFAYAIFTEVDPFDEIKASPHGTAGLRPYECSPKVLQASNGNLPICKFACFPPDSSKMLSTPS